MKDYYEILDVPVTASPAEIKAQYRQLVRIYHPDRFRDQDDKIYAEEKLKEINIAFQVLSGSSVQREPFEARVAPHPVAQPSHLDFGTVPLGQKRTQTLRIDNFGGPAEGVNFVYSDEHSWFQAAKGKRLHAGQPFPLNVAVTVDTRRLQPGERYQEWLEAVLDGIPVRVGIQLQVAERQPQNLLSYPRSLSQRTWAALGTLVLLLLSLFILVLNTNGFALPGVSLAARSAFELDQSSMLFPVYENGVPVLYADSGADVMPRRLDVVGARAAGSHSGKRLAYLSQVADVEQIFLLAWGTGEVTQLTTSSAPKSMLSWSPDGKYLAYLTGDAQNRQIGVYDVALGEEHLLPGELVAGVSHFDWSPDGQSLLFERWQDDERRIYRMGIHGDGLRQLTDYNSWGALWAANGAEILVATENGLYLLGESGQQLYQISDTIVDTFSWSANGEWIAYTAKASQSSQRTVQPLEDNTIWLMDRDGQNVRQITHEGVWYQWNPADSTLGFVTGNQDSQEPLLYLWTFTPGAQPALVAEVNEPHFAWLQ